MCLEVDILDGVHPSPIHPRRSPSRSPSQRYSGGSERSRRLRLGPDRVPSVRRKPWRGACSQGQSLSGRTSRVTPHLTPITQTDIATLTAGDLSRLNADLWLLSPSCQPYTVLNPLAKGATDPRAQSFLHLIDNVLPELSTNDMHPRHLLVENVAGFQVRELNDRDTSVVITR